MKGAVSSRNRLRFYSVLSQTNWTQSRPGLQGYHCAYCTKSRFLWEDKRIIKIVKMISAPSCLYFSAHRKQSNFPTHGVHPVLITSSTHFSWYTYTYTHTCIKSECRGSLVCLLRGSEIFYAAVDQIHFKSGFDINIVGQVQVLALTESWFLVGLDYNTALQPLLITHRTSNIRR